MGKNTIKQKRKQKVNEGNLVIDADKTKEMIIYER